jgi:hypothetical protein
MASITAGSAHLLYGPNPRTPRLGYFLSIELLKKKREVPAFQVD